MIFLGKQRMPWHIWMPGWHICNDEAYRMPRGGRLSRLGGSVKGPSGSPPASRYYGIEMFKRDPQLGPHYEERHSTSEKSLLNLDNLNQIWIVITLFQLIWHSKRYCVWCWINWNSVITIQIWLNWTRIGKDFAGRWTNCGPGFNIAQLLVDLQWVNNSFCIRFRWF